MTVYRLDKLISDFSDHSRREAADMIKSGQVRVDRLICRDPARKFPLSGISLMLKDELLPLREDNTLLLYKPAGYLSSPGEKGGPTVLELIARADRYPAFNPAGRLDKDTTGLLLLTSDGDYCHRIISPKSKIYKTYRFTLTKPLDEEDIRLIAEGITLENGEHCLPGRLSIPASGNGYTGELMICEGKYHQVKRMMQALGKPLLSLHRHAIGSLTLPAGLNPGEYLRLGPEEKSLVFK